MYTRPHIQEQEFRDARGEVIRYGSRWGLDGPPTETYSVRTHPERFAPLRLVAESLMDALDVQPAAAGSMFGRLDPGESSRFDPPNAGASPIVIAFTQFPGVRLRAGAHFVTAFPHCGCDACDESVSDAIDQLEQLVFAIVEGRFTESAEGNLVGHRITVDNGWSGGSSAPEMTPLEDASGNPLQPQPWAAWKRRIRD